MKRIILVFILAAFLPYNNGRVIGGGRHLKSEEEDKVELKNSLIEMLDEINETLDEIKGNFDHIEETFDLDESEDNYLDDISVRSIEGKSYFIGNTESKRYLYAQRNLSGEAGVGATKAKGYADQKWKLEPTSYLGKTAFHIKNAETNRYLYAHWWRNNGEKGFGAKTFLSKADFNDQKWFLIPTTYNGKPATLIQNAHTSRYIYATSGKEMENGVGAKELSKGEATSPDQVWIIQNAAPTPPATKTITGKTYANCQGTYTPSNDTFNGKPIWDRDSGGRFAFYNSDGKWGITGSQYRKDFVGKSGWKGAFVASLQKTNDFTKAEFKTS